MKRSKWALIGAALAVALVGSTTAIASPPDISRVAFQEEYVDTNTCPGIPIETRLDAHITITVFSATRVQVHQRMVYTASANGKSFTDNESFTELANPETGVSTFRGSVVSIQVPHWGNVLLDAGTVTIDFTTDPWTVLHSGGPHQLLFEGYGALCSYLSS
jgi:hypothetical protein